MDSYYKLCMRIYFIVMLISDKTHFQEIYNNKEEISRVNIALLSSSWAWNRMRVAFQYLIFLEWLIGYNLYENHVNIFRWSTVYLNVFVMQMKLFLSNANAGSASLHNNLKWENSKLVDDNKCSPCCVLLVMLLLFEMKCLSSDMR